MKMQEVMENYKLIENPQKFMTACNITSTYTASKSGMLG